MNELERLLYGCGTWTEGSEDADLQALLPVADLLEERGDQRAALVRRVAALIYQPFTAVRLRGLVKPHATPGGAICIGQGADFLPLKPVVALTVGRVAPVFIGVRGTDSYRLNTGYARSRPLIEEGALALIRSEDAPPEFSRKIIFYGVNNRHFRDCAAEINENAALIRYLMLCAVADLLGYTRAGLHALVPAT